MRSSIVIMKLPPVVMLTTASVDCLMVGRKRLNSAGSPEGRPLAGSRACRCRIAAPASAAPIACAAMSSGLIGQRVRHGRRMDRAGDRATDDHLVRRNSFFQPFFTPVGRNGRVDLHAARDREQLYMKPVGEIAVDALRRKQHRHDGDRAERDEIDRAEIGQRLAQREEDDRSRGSALRSCPMPPITVMKMT